MKNKINTALLIILIVIVVGIYLYESDKTPFGKSSAIWHRQDIIGQENDVYRLIDGTTTAAFSIGESTDQLDYNVSLYTKDATGTINWWIFFSNDTDCASTTDLTIAWFGEDINSVSGATITHQAATTTHTWTPGVADATTTRNVGLANLAAKCVKFKFYTNFATPNEDRLWVEMLKKDND